MVKLWHICIIKFFQLLKTSKCVCINIFKSLKDSNLGKETSCKTVVVPRETLECAVCHWKFLENYAGSC